ncbi:ATP-binding cassette domain-containing protein [Aerococcus sp. 1KP-2016]|jgi:putative ABC transport system ATP-binding protein|uniref:ABC transporter ATP-binding protein n=1 Tax=Aerococcus sp. 1KP-2016 TaxID=1981982 RepID=UPI000B97D627|nr:ATP-binding cassette domain-containing protein [Aerococcus sp. 1KP-2016]OYQ67898.1 ABC transporter [Aerococcus sp. 1KP-2016]
MTSVVTFDNVSFKPNEEALLSDVSFEIEQDEMIRIEGPSGSGKSTLLKLISSLIPRTTGQILFEGKSIEAVGYQEYRKAVSYVAQNPHLFGQTIRDNFELVFEAHDADFDEAKVLTFMKQFGLSHIELDKSIHKISGGEKQRVGLIRHLLFPPKVLLLDEITSSLDEENRHRVWEILLDYKQQHKVSILWVSHIEDNDIFPDRIFQIKNRALTIEKGAAND